MARKSKADPGRKGTVLYTECSDGFKVRVNHATHLRSVRTREDMCPAEFVRRAVLKAVEIEERIEAKKRAR